LRAVARRRVAVITGSGSGAPYHGLVYSEMIEAMLGARKNVRHCEPGTSIFSEGQQPLGVYVVHEGVVDLTYAARNGEAKPLRVADRGEILGLSAVMTHSAHEASATARSECEIGFVGRVEFLRALEETPAVWFAVLHLLSYDLNAAYEQLRTLAG
jgi:CRP-like cAMP-binding protein